ncbi:MFS transporter [Sphingomonas sp.]|uniref:MFS transporter n=1 Tax=Sphingomonas sp. TaxID=28214 RepID=UPI003CC58AB5
MADHDVTSPGPSLTAGQIAGVVAGNGLEFYDFLTFSFFAAQIGRTLFPQGGGHGLTFALATFGVGFVTRPLGGFIIGRIADRRGRKPAMLLTFSCMGVAIVGLALTPGYAAIGMAAPVLAVALRMLQGFALGGEVGPNTAFLLEAAPAGRRALYVSFQYATQDAAVLLSGCVGLALSSALAPAQLDSWGWRVAFLIGAAIVPFGLWMRRSLGETLHVAAQDSAGEPEGSYRVIATGGLLVLAAGTIANYTLDYLTTFAQDTLQMRTEIAFGATIALGLTNVVVGLASGLLADRFGRKRVLILPWLLLILTIVPAFSVMAAYRSSTALLTMTVLLAVLLSMCTGPALVLFSEAVPARVRAGSIGLIYALSIAIFGGSAQFVDHQLIDWTGNPVAPAWYTLTALVVGLTGVAMIPERKPPPLTVEPGAAAMATA